jgi:hypothetical protein
MNDRAAGREAGHADNDWKDRECSAIHTVVWEDDGHTDNPDFTTGSWPVAQTASPNPSHPERPGQVSSAFQVIFAPS